MKRRFAPCSVLLVMALAAGSATTPLAGQSLPEVLEAIDHARVTTRILYVTAHPDDEPPGVLTYLSRGLGADVALLCLTRGEGGQNALGPEQGRQLGIVRTEELLAATHAYGVRLYFTRALDFGYSKTAEETLKVWGETALDDLVRVIRTFRPHVVLNNWGGGRTGHGHHQAAGILTPQALAAAADAKAFPEQLTEGLQPWRVTLLLQRARGDAAYSYRIPSDQISSLRGRSYNEIGRDAFLNHRTQGLAAFLGSPFLRGAAAVATPDGAQFDPAQLALPLASLDGNLPAHSERIRSADRALAAAREAALRLAWPEAVRALGVAGREITAARDTLGGPPDSAEGRLRWELDRVQERIDAALAAAVALRVEAQADRSELVVGEGFSVRVEERHRAEMPVEIGKPSLTLPAGWSVAKVEADPAGAVRFTVAIPKDAPPPSGPNDWMLPWQPSRVAARVRAVIEGYAFEVAAPVLGQRTTSTRADTVPLRLVPAVTLALEPPQFIVVMQRPPKQLELLARVHSYGAAAVKINVGLDAPPGWRTSPPQTLEFSGPGDQLARFVVTPPTNLAPGNYALSAYARRDSGSLSSGHSETFRASLEPLPSLPTRLWSAPAVSTVRAFVVNIPEGLRVGYVAAENDPLPEALRQLGVHVELLDPVALAFGDLRRFDAIAIGIRAYELRQDLARANQRLLDYAAAGGTLVVQYQREYVWSALKPAPYPARIGQPAVRITDENSPVRFLAPDHPVLNFPNKILPEDFRGWVQERGLYFWSQFDPSYQPVLALRDLGEQEATGGLVYARTGKGVYIYTGLAFFRQMPEGVPGAYRLFVNLLSQAKATADAR